MEITQATKQTLMVEIEHLSPPYIVELQRFIQYLKFKQSGQAIQSHDRSVLATEQDPVLRAIGLLDMAPFSDAIDDILYGVV